MDFSSDPFFCVAMPVAFRCSAETHGSGFYVLLVTFLYNGMDFRSDPFCVAMLVAFRCSVGALGYCSLGSLLAA